MSMSNVRMVLWGALAALLVVAYQQWNLDYGKVALGPVTAEATPSSGQIAGGLGESIPQTAPALATTPAAPPASAATLSPAGSLSAPASAAPSDADTRIAPPLHILTDVLDVSINLKGGELNRADLLQYPLHKDTPNTPLRLLSADLGAPLYVVQSGLTSASGEAAPTHLAVFTAPQSTYQLEPGADELRVPLTWTDQGVSVTKTFLFKRGQYTVDVEYDVKNGGAAPRKFSPYAQILRHWEHPSRSYFDVETYSFKGPAVYDGTKSKDLNVENDTDAKYAATVTGGWLASLQHQFVTAIVPPAGQPYQYQLQVKNNQYLLSATGPAIEVPPGASATFKQEFFVGPKLQSQLAAANRNLERTVDFGVLTILAQPLFTGLNFVHKLVGNWGWSIIIVTALIKLIFYPLSQASGRSMARMRSVQPRLKQIQETFKDDREKLGRAMMELYKKEKINPLAGCLPMVVQIPVFISFYRVLLESVEMRQAPFLLWINDLSARDPFFVLPLFMGGAMFMQSRLNPMPADPMQAKVMQFMPLVMTGMMAWFPSGLVLYWLTNTVLSIVQQWRVNQLVEREANKPRS